MARPPKYNAARHKAICDDLRLGCSRTTAAELAGINRHTLTDWCERYPTFSADVDAAIASCKSTASRTIRQAILKGDVQSAFRYLALQERDEWQERKQLDIAIEFRKKAERMADALGIPADDLIHEAEAIAAGSWDTWTP
jgi:hypothetical protein